MPSSPRSSRRFSVLSVRPCRAGIRNFLHFPPCFCFSAAAVRISLLVSFPLRLLPCSRIQKERAGGCWLGAPKLSTAACPRIEPGGTHKEASVPKASAPEHG